jgi:valyl-tRNA synthetase
MTTLATTLSTLLRLFAPFLPFVTEEVWSWWQEGSVHRQPWPEPEAVAGDPSLLPVVATVVSAIRKAKSEAQLSQRAAVDLATISGPADQLAAVRTVASDLADAGSIAELAYTVDEGPLRVDVQLASA